jgi:precorrin-6Y C5,15-methyltransferase (decarboxylating)
MTQPIWIIGVGDNGRRSLNEEAKEAIQSSQVLYGGERLLAMFPDVGGERVAIRSNLAEVAEQLKRYRTQGKKQVVLASGDPNFFGIAHYLYRKVGKDAFRVIPNLSSVQLAFARVKESWQDAALASVHGRNMDGVVGLVRKNRKVALLTDETNHPAAIARLLMAAGIQDATMYVAENLDGADERVTQWRLPDVVDETFSPLNVVIILRDEAAAVSDDWLLGIEDECFSQRKPDKGLITKKEVRVVSLAQMQIRPDSVVWDIGTASGSVAIEAAGLAPYGRVYAIEKNEQDVAIARQNIAKFGRPVQLVHGIAPQGLEDFADPDAVFIGGSGGELEELVDTCCNRLREGGRIVMNAATIENLSDALRAFAANQFETNVILLQVSRSKPILGMTRFEGLNPVYIITAWRKQD